MSMVPFLLEDDLFSPRRSFCPAMFGSVNYFDRQLRSMEEAMKRLDHVTSARSQVTRDKDKFQLSVDVHQFAPSELSVVVKGKEVVVEGKHEEKQDEHGYVERHFLRRFTIPEGHKPEDVVSSLSSDGVLTITAPRRPALGEGERAVPIQATGPLHQSIKQQVQTKGDESKMQD